MRFKRIRTILRVSAASLAMMLGAAAARGAPPPVSAFAALPAMGDMALSPSGNLLAWADYAAAAPRVVVFDITSRKVVRLFAAGGAVKLRSIEWADDDTVLITLSQTTSAATTLLRSHRAEVFRTMAAKLSTGQSRMLLMADGARPLVTGASLVAMRTTKPGTVVMSTLDYAASEARQETGTRLAGRRADSGWVAKLFEVDTQTGKGRLIETGSQYTLDWVVDADGRAVARSEWNPAHDDFRVLARRGSGWDSIYVRRDGGDLSLEGLSADGTAVLALGSGNAGRQVLFAIPLDGSGARVLLEDPDHDVDAVIHDPLDGALTGVVLGGMERERRWIDDAARRRYESLQRTFPDRTVRIYGRSADARRIVTRVSGTTAAPVYYFVDFDTHQAMIVGEEYPALTGVRLGEVRAIRYAARDGTSIPAYLTLPPGAAGRSLPLVVLPHGGPEARDSGDFDPWAQLLASRGYAVLQPQFRGSSGFGDAFRLAGYHQWGGLMQDDVSDGVGAMVAQGIADPKRVCIVGASYGGYAALAGAAFTPELYRCAVSVSGVSDLPVLLARKRNSYGAESDAIAHWNDSIGSPFDRNVIERSPARAAAQVRIPILLVHGVDDTVVPIEQSELMARALDEEHKPYSFVRLPGEDHFMSRAETRLEIMQAVNKFLAENL